MGAYHPFCKAKLTSPIEPTPPTIHWDQGVYAKIEHYQIVSPSVNTYFPTNPLQAGGVVKQLVDRAWMKGILIEVPWGEICTGAGAYNWTFTDKVFLDIKNECPTKKVMILLPLKVFGTTVSEVSEVLPTYLQSINGTYGSGDTIYKLLWNHVGTVLTDSGYHLNLFQFQDGLTGDDANSAPVYTLRDAYYDFLQAIADRYSTGSAYEDIFAGVQTSESASLTVTGSFPNSVNNHFKGRIALLKKLKDIFPDHMVMEDCNFNSSWTDVMTQTGLTNSIGSCASDGLIANRIAYTQSNFHTGTTCTGGLTSICCKVLYR